MRFDSPVGTQTERDSDRIPAGAWYDATGFATYYTASGSAAYHTGADLNLPADADYRLPVYAVADGLCVFASNLPGWFFVIVTKHILDDGSVVYARYAHVEQPRVNVGTPVARGQAIAVVGTYTSPFTTNHHLHFDLARIDLALHPGDWPGADRARLIRDYVDPLVFIREHHRDPKGVDPLAVFPRNMVVANFGSSIDGIGARVRDDANQFIGSLQQGNVIEVHAIDSDGYAHLHLKTDSGLRLVGATTLAEPEVRIHASLLVELSNAPHPSPNFRASSLKVYPTQAITLSWLIQGVRGVKLDTVPEVGDVGGQRVERIREPQVTTTYTLRVQYNDGYVIEYPVQVEVTGPAPFAG